MPPNCSPCQQFDVSPTVVRSGSGRLDERATKETYTGAVLSMSWPLMPFLPSARKAVDIQPGVNPRLVESEMLNSVDLIEAAILWRSLRLRLLSEHPRTLKTNREVTVAQQRLDKIIDKIMADSPQPACGHTKQNGPVRPSKAIPARVRTAFSNGEGQ